MGKLWLGRSPCIELHHLQAGHECLGYTPDEEDSSQVEDHKFYSGLIIKRGARRFFCSQEGRFRMDCPLFWEAPKNQSQPKHEPAFVAVPNTRNGQAEKRQEVK